MDSGASAENPALHARPWNKFRFLIDSSFLPLYMKQDRKSTRLNSKSPVHLVCRLLLEKKKKPTRGARGPPQAAHRLHASQANNSERERRSPPLHHLPLLRVTLMPGRMPIGPRP